ncbi:uncharacterized protein LOC126685995 [Mercurialis annua]|uniref:uncharacterized protein LOC126685995 n=1 Tax=Mercurialis annua TaxID=3986 RepID=UPI00215FDBBE|nr:uncharacterized protein LOC126685995 [Mercurialis annua]
MQLEGAVDKEKNRVIFVESDGDFVDVLFTFLTMPMGEIVKLMRKYQQTKTVGCMDNLYASIENLDSKCFSNETCRKMLLNPANGAATQCKKLKPQINDTKTFEFFSCENFSRCRLVSQYEGTICDCGKGMCLYAQFDNDICGSQKDGGFVKRLTRVMISDELQVMPLSTASAFSFLSKLGVIDGNAIAGRTFDIGSIHKVVNLLKSSLVSETSLTEILLKPNEIPEISKKTSKLYSFSLKTKSGDQYTSKGNDKIRIKLMLSKSNKKVCYAEAGEDFVDLLFSFLTVPLGYILKEMNGAVSNGCIHHLYNSIACLDVETYFKSDYHKEILLSPKVAPNLGYENQLLRVEEAVHPEYHSVYSRNKLRFSIDKLSIHNDPVHVKDPKLSDKVAKTSGGFVMMGPAMFTVTDDLIVTPISIVSGVSILSKLKVPFTDLEDRSVYVGTKEAVHLMIASFISESALTDTSVSQILKVPKQES